MSDEPIDELALRRRMVLLKQGKGFLSCDSDGCKRVLELTAAADADPAWFIKTPPGGEPPVVLCPLHRPWVADGR